MTTSATRHIGLREGIALYVSAILGAGVLTLPAQVASLAGPASLLSWGFACAMGVPLAWMFACLARRMPEAGGVATYVGAAFGNTLGGITGWLYFAAGSVGQTVVPLTGGYYVAQALHLSRGWAFMVAAVILAFAVVTNLVGLRTSGAVQIALAAGIGIALVVTIVAAVPSVSAQHLTPFAPHGIGPVGSGVIVLFFAFAGWEAVAHLAGEFTDPDRDVQRAVGATIVIVSVLYLGLAAAVVLTGTYGNAHVDHIAVGLLLHGAFGSAADPVAAAVAVVVSLATTNAFVAGVSRLGMSLGQTGWLPRAAAHKSRRGTPVGGVVSVALVAAVGLVLAVVFDWGTETLVVIPSTLVVTVYLLAAAAGCKVLHGIGRTAAVTVIVLTLLVVPSAAQHVVIPVVVAVVALGARAVLLRAKRSSLVDGGDTNPDTGQKPGTTTERT